MMGPSPNTTLWVSGLEIHVYGLDALRVSRATAVDVVFLLHGRTGSYKDLDEFAQAILAKDKDASLSNIQRGLLVVSFDQRNHGHRKVSNKANQGWAQGNQFHGQDMYAIQHGTSQDVSLLITFLPMFLFPQAECRFANLICAGISLGGHVTYLVLSNDARVAAGVVVIGCPDFTPLMLQRAGGEGRDAKMPPSLLAMAAQLDPKLENVSKKDLLILKGDDDKLVPWSASQGFVSALPPRKTEVIGYPGVGHKFTDKMLNKSAEWIVTWRHDR